MPTHVEKKEKKSRIVEIDFIRGVLIWFMIVDHLFFDFANVVTQFFTSSDWGMMQRLYNLQTIGFNYWQWPLRIAVRFIILCLFFFISGISTYFSKNNLKRGLIIFGVGALVNLAFFVVGKILDDGSYCFFGAISCFGTSILIYWLLRFLFKKICPNHESDFKWIALALGVVVVAIGMIFWRIELNGPALPGSEQKEIIDHLSWDNFMQVIIGLKEDAPGSMDWLPLFPFMGFLFIGSFIGEVFYKDRKSFFKPLPTRPSKDDATIKKVGYYGGIMPYKGIKNVITFSGHYSLFFYILHQVVLIAILGIVLLSMGYKLNFNL